MTTINPRIADHPVDPQFVSRWSPRAFSQEIIDKSTLLTFFEAARWAPSSYNSQPWRFIYATRDSEHWAQFLGFLNDFNRSWATRAAALVIVLSKRSFVPTGATEEVLSVSHSFDSGAAWGYLALQASLAGWHAHGLAGIERDRIRAELNIPDTYFIEAGIAIGRLGDKASLPETLQARESHSPRKPLIEIATEGRFIA
jgi:nitroreductase